MVVSKLQKFLIDHSNDNSYEYIPHHEDNHVICRPIVHFEDEVRTVVQPIALLVPAW